VGGETHNFQLLWAIETICYKIENAWTRLYIFLLFEAHHEAAVRPPEPDIYEIEKEKSANQPIVSKNLCAEIWTRHYIHR